MDARVSDPKGMPYYTARRCSRYRGQGRGTPPVLSLSSSTRFEASLWAPCTRPRFAPSKGERAGRRGALSREGRLRTARSGPSWPCSSSYFAAFSFRTPVPVEVNALIESPQVSLDASGLAIQRSLADDCPQRPLARLHCAPGLPITPGRLVSRASGCPSGTAWPGQGDDAFC